MRSEDLKGDGRGLFLNSIGWGKAQMLARVARVLAEIRSWVPFKHQSGQQPSLEKLTIVYFMDLGDVYTGHMFT